MMAHSYSGWAPPDRVRRSVALPVDLDERIAEYAIAHNSTPSTVLADTLQQAVAKAFPGPNGVTHAPLQGSNDSIERAVVLKSSVNEALDECVHTLRFGHNGNSADISFSDLVVALVDYQLQKNGNGVVHFDQKT